ncbi:MAG: 30S ribosomal protein S20, small subunit ribosomal protein S20 [Candidatus Peregrinibacteria bacterium GW2011_GWF2_43_17]|nr:MAG: 30S ribosomal protein S20, small subunit ribosomal protein S20 [Candidatus Peregrinibacteria bacterium GW2011_GWF2_43_17]KKT20230.1 MAG: 30S ribosomal protein S20 [Candidatus Peregrinibacteria bacterium GW2011_GWA2_43_8]HAU39790.1 hypothetical protein [Candidatus Peregrinibacteria bacterium]
MLKIKVYLTYRMFSHIVCVAFIDLEYTNMPITSAAKKALRKSRKNQKTNYNLRAKLRKVLRTFNDLIKAGKIEDAKKLLAKAQKEIDMATKKHIIHKNNANRKKSSLARMLKVADGKKK